MCAGRVTCLPSDYQKTSSYKMEKSRVKTKEITLTPNGEGVKDTATTGKAYPASHTSNDCFIGLVRAWLPYDVGGVGSISVRINQRFESFFGVKIVCAGRVACFQSDCCIVN